MNRYLPIRRVYAREVLDSRGNPTVEVEVTVGEGVIGLEGCTARAVVPSGASTGQYEAEELRDGNTLRYRGKGVLEAVKHVNTELAEVIIGENALLQTNIDKILCEIDGTENKRNMGSNAILGISMAVARAAAKALRIPLYQYLGGCYTISLPVPMLNVLNGGKHAENTIDFQEFMLVPKGAENFREALRMGTEIYHSLKKLLIEKKMLTSVGDEGGFAPNLKDTESVFDILTAAVEKAGYHNGSDIGFALDAAASELYRKEKNQYYFPGESQEKGSEIHRTREELICYYEQLTCAYPIVSIEDALEENDWEGWKELTKRLGKRVQLVGDDLFVTNAARLNQGISMQAANAVLIKPNQIGTVSETMKTIDLAHKSGYKTIISHRSGDSEDAFIADLAVAVNAGQIKTGAPCRSERNVKYNHLLRIEETLNDSAQYSDPFAKF